MLILEQIKMIFINAIKHLSIILFLSIRFFTDFKQEKARSQQLKCHSILKYT